MIVFEEKNDKFLSSFFLFHLRHFTFNNLIIPYFHCNGNHTAGFVIHTWLDAKIAIGSPKEVSRKTNTIM